MPSEQGLDTAAGLGRKTRLRLRTFVASASPEQLFLLIAIPALLIALPWIMPSFRLMTLAVITTITAIVLYGLMLLYGQTGILSIGHGALWGVGGYLGAVLLLEANLSFWAALPLVGLGAALVAGVLGFPALRVSGHHFVILTFAFAEIFVIAMGNGGSLTGDREGRILDDRVAPVLGLTFESLESFYFLSLFFLFITLAAVYFIIRSPLGRSLRAIRENEPLAQSLGINPTYYKIGIFMLGGVFAGVSGLLYAYFLRHVSPDLFGAFPGIQLVLMLLIGGAGWLLGPLAGAVVVGFLPEVTDAVGFGINPLEIRIVYGIALLLVILFLPQGLVAGIASAYTYGKSQILALLWPRAPLELAAESAEDSQGEGASPSARGR